MIKQFPKNKEYFISDSGDVFRVVKLKQTENVKGYLRVKIRDETGKRINMMIHRIVMETFSKKQLKKYLQVDHLDKNKKNNNYDNLEIVTMLENIQRRDAGKDTPF